MKTEEELRDKKMVKDSSSDGRVKKTQAKEAFAKQATLLFAFTKLLLSQCLEK